MLTSRDFVCVSENGWSVVFDFPIALALGLSLRSLHKCSDCTYPEELAKGRVIWLAGFALHIFL